MGRGRRGGLRPLGRAPVTWRGLRTPGRGAGAVQGRASVASGSVQFLENELGPETNAESPCLVQAGFKHPPWYSTKYGYSGSVD